MSARIARTVASACCASAAACWAVVASAARVDVPAQMFDAGGWGLDVQFMDVMGSPYLIAHGKGIPVTDATASVDIPEDGAWRVWVRARKWVDGAGGFNVRVGGVDLARTFGVSQVEWAWEDGGEVSLRRGKTEVRLVDSDGFDGRCAGVVLAKEGAVPEGPLAPEGEAEAIEADFVVVGGGLPGTCAAVAAARRGLRVALVQDRPVLGGNSSSEIRVWSAGEMRYPLVKELRGWFMNRMPDMTLSDANRMRVVGQERNLRVFLRTRAYGVEKSGASISAVKALDWGRNRCVVFRAPLFCDATGDGWIGYYAKADCRMGREARDEYDESFAPEKADGDTLGASLMWTSAEANVRIPFSAPWAEPWAQGETAVNGEWNWEYGIHRDMIADGEAIRDRLLLAVYGAFSRAKRDPKNSRRVLNFLPYLLGKRESRRIMGDWVLSERDVAERRPFEDAVASGSWSIDLHYDDAKPGVDFLTTCRQPHYGRYWIPYRSIYSRNVPNLFVAGRCFSCTHVGLGGPRVVCTLSQLGVAAGEAAALCRRDGCLPRGVWESGKFRELQRRLGGDFPGNPDPAHAKWRIVDDEDDGVVFGEGWKANHNCNGGQIGNFSHYPQGSSSAKPLDGKAGGHGNVVYPLPVERAGRYALMGRVPYCWFAAADSATSFVVSSGGMKKSFEFNQATDCGEWVKMGEFDLEPGATLTLVPAKSHGLVIADGFAVVPVD